MHLLRDKIVAVTLAAATLCGVCIAAPRGDRKDPDKSVLISRPEYGVTLRAAGNEDKAALLWDRKYKKGSKTWVHTTEAPEGTRWIDFQFPEPVAVKAVVVRCSPGPSVLKTAYVSIHFDNRTVSRPIQITQNRDPVLVFNVGKTRVKIVRLFMTEPNWDPRNLNAYIREIEVWGTPSPEMLRRAAEAAEPDDPKRPLPPKPGPDDPVTAVLVNSGEKAYKSGDCVKALKILDEAIERSPLTPKAHYLRGLALGKLNKRYEAADALREARRLLAGVKDPTSAERRIIRELERKLTASEKYAVELAAIRAEYLDTMKALAARAQKANDALMLAKAKAEIERLRPPPPDAPPR